MADAPKRPLVTDEMLAAVTERMADFHERYYGRQPGSTQAHMMDNDVIACLFGSVYTDVEKTLIEMQRQALVHESRTAFQEAMEDRFIRTVEQLTGRTVENFFSAHHVGPDLELELFVLGPATETQPGAIL